MNALLALNPAVAVAYRRVSSSEQERASGPERQRSKIAAFAADRGLTLAADHFEDRSGTLPMAERPELAAALTSCLEYGAGVLLVEEPSRLARDEFAAHDAVRSFTRAGVRIFYTDGRAAALPDDAAGMLQDGMGHLMAAYERRTVVSRMAAGRAIKAKAEPRSRAQGGRLPHGYRRSRSGGVEVDPIAAAEVVEVFELIRAGKGVRAVAEIMTARTKRRWLPNTVARIVKREEYKRGAEWRIVDPRVWNDAQAAMAARRRS